MQKMPFLCLALNATNRQVRRSKRVSCFKALICSFADKKSTGIAFSLHRFVLHVAEEEGGDWQVVSCILNIIPSAI